MSHKDLVMRGQRWLKNTKRCPIVVTELVTGHWEVPDVLGWFGTGWSILLECKASRADFLRDKKKHHRQFRGLGQERYYLVPDGLISAEEVPQEWGLLYVQGKRILTVKPACKEQWNKDTLQHEAQILVSLLRRAQIRGFDCNCRWTD